MNKCWEINVNFIHVSHQLMSNIWLNISNIVDYPVVNWPNLSNHLWGWLWWQNDGLITYWELNFNFMSVISWCPILDKYWTTVEHLALSQQPDHLWGWFWYQNDHLIIYCNFNFRHVKYWRKKFQLLTPNNHVLKMPNSNSWEIVEMMDPNCHTCQQDVVDIYEAKFRGSAKKKGIPKAPGAVHEL